MKFINLVLIAAIVAVVLTVFYHSRQIFYHVYEPEYYENLYYHSQWNIPQSTRGISDAELYKFVGYRLVAGENPFNINFEVPPFGKYLYGLSEHLFANGFVTSILFYLSSLVLVYVFARKLFPDKQLSLLTLLLFVTTPFVATEVRETMLDLPLMFLFLAHIYFFVCYLASKKGSSKKLLEDKAVRSIVFSGIFMGLATGTKIGAYTPLALLVGMVFILWKSRSFLQVGIYGMASVAGYVLSYFSYFMRHPNPIPWLRLHEKPINFYGGPGGNVDNLNQWKGIFLNRYQGWWGDSATTLGDWSPLLPVGTVLAGAVLLWAIRKGKREWAYISAFAGVVLIVNSFLSFYPRYLMPAIPLFVLLSAKAFSRARYLIVVLALLNMPFFHSSIIVNEPERHTGPMAHFVSVRAYREIYRGAIFNEPISEEVFISTYEGFLDGIGTRRVSAEVIEVEHKGNSGVVTMEVTYDTHHGKLSFTREHEIAKVHNKWKTVWNWDIVWPGYTPDSDILVEEGTIALSRVENGLGQTLARRGQGYMLYMIPRLMADWNKTLTALAGLTGEGNNEVNARIRGVVPAEYPRFVGYVSPMIENLEEIELPPGASLRPTGYVEIVNGDRKAVAEGILRLRSARPEIFYLRSKVYLENNGKRITLPFYGVETEDTVVRI